MTLGRPLTAPHQGRLDFGAFLGDGRMLAQAAHIPVHLGAMPASVQAAIAQCAPFAPGDVIIVNDPYQGGNHLPDITLVSPVFFGNPLSVIGKRLSVISISQPITVHRPPITAPPPSSSPAAPTTPTLAACRPVRSALPRFTGGHLFPSTGGRRRARGGVAASAHVRRPMSATAIGPCAASQRVEELWPHSWTRCGPREARLSWKPDGTFLPTAYPPLWR